ncbi:MAG: type II toxin-antitoxin system RelE/ParE family toxin [Methanoregulaceae archaeon]|jgi:mRNA interferase RelE/StbE|nr:type II toxin-antitoxin system RelE/ParE family toxin [Methanoregulaceae archaeon]MCU0628612.1 type II toxin-antitoxin system RelE/ParE family toxin [Methanoregulaceae archaeon]
MEAYSLVLKKSVEKDLRKIPKEIIPDIFEHIERLMREPVPHDSYKIAGSENLYRIRVGDYRVIYQVLHGSREVTVIYIRHRSVAYRGL